MHRVLGARRRVVYCLGDPTGPAALFDAAGLGADLIDDEQYERLRAATHPS